MNKNFDPDQNLPKTAGSDVFLNTDPDTQPCVGEETNADPKPLLFFGGRACMDDT